MVDATTTGYKWNLTADRTIDWSISDGFAGEHFTDPTTVQLYVGQALSLFSYYANVKFNYTGYFSSPISANSAGAEINVTLDGADRFFTATNQWARGFFPSSISDIAYQGGAGDVYLNINSAANTLPSYEPGSQGWSLLLHELGHTLGLKHPHDGGGSGRPTYDQLGIGDYDKDYVSVMSYDDDYDWNKFSYHPATPMVLDALALQALYGPNTATNAGDSLFSFKETNFYVTVWDASGNDTISFAQATKGWHIEMPEYVLSNAAPASVGLAAPLDEMNLASPHSLYWLLGDYEQLQGSSFADEIIGDSYDNRLFGGAGNDTISDLDGTNFLRGEEGDDKITGGPGFDDANGNMGNDTIHGGAGDDYSVGGKDNDLLFGDAGVDIVWGNLGNDTCEGGDGNDQVRGGQGDDSVSGGVGDDFVSGDRGNDTVSGGAGADLFHGSQDAGIDRVIDFSLAQGDRVVLDPGTVYTLGQVGADTVIDMGTPGNQMILVGVQLSTLTAGWIFVG